MVGEGDETRVHRVLMASETEYAFPSLDMAHNEIYILWGIYSIATIQQNK